MNGPIVGLPGVEISGGPRLLNFQKDSLGSNVDILPGSLFFSICIDDDTVKPVLRGHHWDKEKMTL
jgi:hypothetical protein